MKKEKKTWFITGCSTGFGLELAKYASDQGHQVVGTLRKDEQLEEFNQLNPNYLFGVKMDVTDPDLIRSAVEVAVEKLGTIDVLVNNAGYGSIGTIEETGEAEMQRQFDVNVYGSVRMIQQVLPYMRAQKNGHILNITSIAGLNGFPGVGIYNGSKFALEGIGEALALEVKHLGIKVTNVEPGPFRTDWAGRSATFTPSFIPDYAETATKNMASIQQVSGSQVGDPKKAVKAMFELTKLENPPVHLPLGGPAYKRARIKFTEILQEIDQFEYLGLPTDYTEDELKEIGGGK